MPEGAALNLNLSLSARETISFLAGLSGFVSQAVLAVLHYPVSLDLLGFCAILMGLPFAFKRDEAKRNGGGDGT
jgi:hypothetical protein